MLYHETAAMNWAWSWLILLPRML